ncbi:MAG: rane fusion protein multidrug efflux system [Pseudomonadota bacterium]|nr:rane fusion protein multidrug efflux system [Pseudomonadota bacterium]
MLKRKNKQAIIGISLMVVSAMGVYTYFKYNEYYPSTDDAYVVARLVNVAPKTSGYLTQLNVVNNQVVHKGDLLFKLNPVDYNFTLAQAQKNYDSYLAQVAITQQQLDVQKNSLDKDQAQYNLAQEIVKRYKELYAANTLSKQAYDNALTNLKSLHSQLEIDNKKVAQIQNAVKLMQAKLDSSKSGMDLAQSNVNYTEYYSPVDGYISNLNNMDIGEYINISQQMFGIVDNGEWWIDANFKETQIARIKPGQKVDIELDMYHHKYSGVVQGISYASGNTFSLLPAQNATGNWVKVTQRFTVRIKLKDDPRFPLRVGASSKVTINTVNTAHAVL